MSKRKIFEVVDNTDDEIYYTLGVYLSVRDALNHVRNNNNGKPISEFAYAECEKITIYQRLVGPYSNKKEIYSIYRIEDDKGYWRTIDIWKNGVKVPNFVKINNIPLKRIDDKYYAPQGHWFIEYRIINGKILSWSWGQGLKHLHRQELVEITSQEYSENLGRIPNTTNE